mmetsp:Transcript_53425/g.124392  ORF Transcript_53425/g.124392 Transcript_53425/m.124392 type:complete len:524 (+) Transcript_53425:31-1602(+)
MCSKKNRMKVACGLFAGLLVDFYVFGTREPIRWLDSRISGEEHFDSFGNLKVPQDFSAMPDNCSSIVRTDIVPHAVISECLSWCREGLGRGSGIVLLANPLLSFQAIIGNTAGQVYVTCWKTETASFGMWLMPSTWQMYLLVLAYSSFSSFVFLWTWYYSPTEHNAQGPKEERSLSPGRGPFPMCCYAPPTDRARADVSMCLAAFFRLLEPATDVLSVLVFVRSGQPFYAIYVSLAILLSLLAAGDFLQVRGARAMAKSLARGYATPELLHHEVAEETEAMMGTMVQTYALFQLDIAEIQHPVSVVLPILFSIGLSMAIGLPNMRTTRSLLANVAAADLDNFYKVDQEKKQVGMISKYAPAFTICCFVFSAHCFLELMDPTLYHHCCREMLLGLGNFGSLRPFLSSLPWRAEHWLIAWMLLLFRCCVILASPLSLLVCIDMHREYREDRMYGPFDQYFAHFDQSQPETVELDRQSLPQERDLELSNTVPNQFRILCCVTQPPSDHHYCGLLPVQATPGQHREP